MADDDKPTAEAAVKRGPGRPRRAESAEPSKPRATAADDPRIGTFAHETASMVGFEDGSHYRVSEGVLVERLD